MRQYEEARDPIPPGHAERDRDEHTPEPGDVLCVCGHDRDRHHPDGDCLAVACRCSRFVEEVRS